MDENQKLLDINQDLESKGINLRIEKRGKVLNIRGSLPDKKSHNLSKIQRISLKLPYDINGLEEAKKATKDYRENLAGQLDKEIGYSAESKNKIVQIIG